MQDKKRVVVTGMGAVTPIGHNVEEFWQGIKEGRCGIGPITHFDTTDFKVHVAAEVKDFDPSACIDKREQRRMDRFCQFGMVAATEAYNDSGLSSDTIGENELAVITGSGIGGLQTIEEEVTKLNDRGPSRVSALMIPMIIGNILSGNIAIKYKAKGECHCIVTACASGTHAIGEGYRLIQDGRAKAVIAGAAEATITPLSIAGFSNMKALSTREDPTHCSTPFDKDRDGFVMGEGAGMLVLEEYDHAKARGARIYGEIAGFGSTCDAFHITLPDESGEGAASAMRIALSDAGIQPEEISYINAHGTSTPPNDAMETAAIKQVFGESAYKIPVSSTKGHTGHMLGAAGAVESVICIKALEEGFVPPTVGLTQPGEGLDLDYVPGKGRRQELTYALSNSLGFGGHNGTLIFKKVTE